MDEAEARALNIDTTVMDPARRYDYLLGGTNHFPVDRESGDMLMRISDTASASARENRRFLARAVEFLVREAGIDQFLDIGSGLPAVDNTHEVVLRHDPAGRVVYVDRSPTVLAHSRALLAGVPGTQARFLAGDLLQPARILADPGLTATLDLGRPVALLLFAVLHFVEHDDQAYASVRTLVDALPSGSYVALSHLSLDGVSPEERAGYEALVAQGRADAFPRSREQVSAFFAGLEPVEPGVVAVTDWRSPVPPGHRTAVSPGWCGLARKP